MRYADGLETYFTRDFGQSLFRSAGYSWCSCCFAQFPQQRLITTKATCSNLATAAFTISFHTRSKTFDCTWWRRESIFITRNRFSNYFSNLVNKERPLAKTFSDGPTKWNQETRIIENSLRGLKVHIYESNTERDGPKMGGMTQNTPQHLKRGLCYECFELC